jgi:hypothetical protein
MQKIKGFGLHQMIFATVWHLYLTYDVFFRNFSGKHTMKKEPCVIQNQVGTADTCAQKYIKVS